MTDELHLHLYKSIHQRIVYYSEAIDIHIHQSISNQVYIFNIALRLAPPNEKSGH